MKGKSQPNPKEISPEVESKAEEILQRALRLELGEGAEWGEIQTRWRNYTQEVWSLRYKSAPTLLGTSLLARALWEDSDPFSLKRIKADPRTYSARSLAHNVLVPFLARHGIGLKGVGREPLNNQPFFRFDSVQKINRAKYPRDIERLRQVLSEIERLSPEQAVVALSAFLQVAKEQESTKGVAAPLGSDVSLPDLVEAVRALLSLYPEGGKPAQAAVAAGVKTLYPYSEVKALSRVNDPGRHYPGDVSLVSESRDHESVVLAVEARGKAVSPDDALIFARQVGEKGVRKALIVDLFSDQEQVRFDQGALQNHGVLLMVVSGVSLFLHLVVGLSPLGKRAAVRRFVDLLVGELQGLGVKEEALRFLNEKLKNSVERKAVERKDSSSSGERED